MTTLPRRCWAGTATVEKPANHFDDRRAVQLPCPEIPLRILGKNFGHRCPVSVVHGAGEQVQCAFHVTFIAQNPQLISDHVIASPVSVFTVA